MMRILLKFRGNWKIGKGFGNSNLLKNDNYKRHILHVKYVNLKNNS